MDTLDCMTPRIPATHLVPGIIHHKLSQHQCVSLSFVTFGERETGDDSHHHHLTC